MNTLLNRYQWLHCSLLFTLTYVSANPSLRNILATDPASRHDILGDDARTQKGTCGGDGSTTDELCSAGERNENCTYECSLLRDPPVGYHDSCEFVEENCDGVYELLNYLQFVECHLGPNLRVSLVLMVLCVVLILPAYYFCSASRIHHIGTMVTLSFITSVHNGQRLL